MAQLDSNRQKLMALGGAIVAAILGGDVAGYTPDLHQIITASPIAVLVGLYLELRLLPWAAPIRRYAMQQLGESEPVDLITPQPPAPVIDRRSGPIARPSTEGASHG